MKKNLLDERGIKLRLKWLRYFKKYRNIAKTSRYFGISRQTFYKWLKRYKNYDRKSLIDQSRKPKNIKYKITLETYKIIKELRINKQWGPFKISKYLKNERDFNLSPSSIYKILRKNKISRLSLVKKLLKN